MRNVGALYAAQSVKIIVLLSFARSGARLGSSARQPWGYCQAVQKCTSSVEKGAFNLSTPAKKGEYPAELFNPGFKHGICLPLS